MAHWRDTLGAIFCVDTTLVLTGLRAPSLATSVALFLLAASTGDWGLMLFAFDEFILDTRAFELTYRGRAVSLQKRPLDLLAYLVAHRDRVVTKAEILTEVWGGVCVTENAVVQAIAHLRNALGPCGVHAIRSVRCRGYRFAIPVDVAPPADSAPREMLRISAHGREPLGTFRSLLRMYAEARPDAVVDGVALASTLRLAAKSPAETVALVLALFGDPSQKPALVMINHLERADLESLLLYLALAARPGGNLVVRGTCSWEGVPRGSAVAQLLRHLDGAPEFAA